MRGAISSDDFNFIPIHNFNNFHFTDFENKKKFKYD